MTKQEMIDEITNLINEMPEENPGGYWIDVITVSEMGTQHRGRASNIRHCDVVRELLDQMITAESPLVALNHVAITAAAICRDKKIDPLGNPVGKQEPVTRMNQKQNAVIPPQRPPKLNGGQNARQ